LFILRFLVGAIYEIDFKKNLLAGETGVQRFSKVGESLFFLMKPVGEWSYPTEALFGTQGLHPLEDITHKGIGWIPLVSPNPYEVNSLSNPFLLCLFGWAGINTGIVILAHS
jgi:hypothetical protein